MSLAACLSHFSLMMTPLSLASLRFASRADFSFSAAAFLSFSHLHALSLSAAPHCREIARGCFSPAALTVMPLSVQSPSAERPSCMYVSHLGQNDLEMLQLIRCDVALDPSCSHNHLELAYNTQYTYISTVPGAVYIHADVYVYYVSYVCRRCVYYWNTTSLSFPLSQQQTTYTISSL